MGAFFLLFCVSCCIGFSSGQNTSGENEKVLRFPVEYSLGEIYVQDDSDLQNALWFNPFNDLACWDMLSPAIGNVYIPAGKRVKLVVNQEAWQKPELLIPLQGLDPNDLYALDLSQARPPARPATDRCIPYILHLTGLRQLDLTDTAITQMGLKKLSVMKHLARMVVPKNLTSGGLGMLVQMKSLTSIRLRQNRIADSAFALLTELPNLKELHLFGDYLTDEGLACLPQLTHLEFLLLGSGKEAFSTKGYSSIAQIPNLRTLWIDSHDCSDEKLALLARHPKLTGLNLCWEGGITDQGIHYISQIPNLKELNISSAKATNQGIQYLGMCRQLEILELPSFGYTDVGILGLSGLIQLKELRVSTASNSPLTDKSLAEIAKLQHLEKFWIAGNGFTDAGMKHLLQLKNLRELLIGTCPSITNEGFAKLAGLENLEILNWCGKSAITFAGLNQFGHHKKLRHFRCTDIQRGSTALDLSGMEALDDLRIEMPREYNKKNRTSTFTDSFSDDDLACLAALKNLSSLCLCGDGIGDKGLIFLKDLKRLDTLFLDGRSDITDKGLRNLSGMNRLWQLIITGHFTDKALEILAEMDSLAVIELRTDRPINHQAIREFRQKKKNLKKWDLRIDGEKQ